MKAKKSKKTSKIDDLILSDYSAGLAPIEKGTLITKRGLEKLKTELAFLESVKRKEVAARIKEAVSYGDLSENSEYEDAKNEQAFVEGRIMILTEQIKYAKIIEDKKITNSYNEAKTVQLGNTVKIKVLGGKFKDEIFDFSIVGTTESDPMQNKISNESPVGAALLEREVGEVIKVKAPVGEVEYKILNIL